MITQPVIPAPTGNPLLDNPALKAQIAAGMKPSPQMQGAVMPPANAPAPPALSLPEPQTAPFPSAKPPVVFGPFGQETGPVAARGTREGDQQERERLLNSGSGISQIAKRIESSGFGQNHPVLGKVLGIGAQGLAQLGDIGLNSVGIGRAIEPLIPGAEGHHQLELRRVGNALNTDIGNEEKEAQTQDVHSQIPLREAQTAHTQEETAELPGQAEERQRLEDAQIVNLLHPQAKTEFEAWRQQNPTAPVADFLKLQGQSKNVPPKEQLQQQLLAAQAKGDTEGAKKIQQQLKDIDPMGEQRITIQQQTAANNQTKASDAKTEKEFNYVRGKWDKDLQTYSTQNEKLAEAAGMVGSGAMGAALGSVKSLSGLAGGQGSGVRITQAELNSIAHARGFKGDFDAFLQQFGDGNKLTPEQVNALKAIISDVQRIAGAKEAVINKALDDLNEAKDPATIRKIDSQVRHVLMGGQ
jgi:hypothetical protein